MGSAAMIAEASPFCSCARVLERGGSLWKHAVVERPSRVGAGMRRQQVPQFLQPRPRTSEALIHRQFVDRGQGGVVDRSHSAVKAISSGIRYTSLWPIRHSFIQKVSPRPWTK